jgi:uracil-DNA glycosylase
LIILRAYSPEALLRLADFFPVYYNRFVRDRERKMNMTSKSFSDGSDYAEGPKDARVMLVGQNPGQEEVKQKRPFVGRTGKYLDRVLREKSIERDELYVTSVVKEPTPGNRKPTPEEIKRWMPCLVSEIEEVAPEIVVLMGKVAWETPRFAGVRYIETYHPAAAMRFPRVRRRFEDDMKTLRRTIRRLGERRRGA